MLCSTLPYYLILGRVMDQGGVMDQRGAMDQRVRKARSLLETPSPFVAALWALAAAFLIACAGPSAQPTTDSGSDGSAGVESPRQEEATRQEQGTSHAKAARPDEADPREEATRLGASTREQDPSQQTTRETTERPEGPDTPETPAPRADASAAQPETRTNARGSGAVPYPALPGETHLQDLRMLTFVGQNAEAYFSADGQQLIFQATLPDGRACDQIYVMDVDGRNPRLVSTGSGRTTCGYFFPSGDRILYSSTHHTGPACPPLPDYSRGYVWPLYDYDIYTAAPDGGDVRPLFRSPGYDAEATLSADGRIVFTSTRDGDLEIYTMDANGGEVRRLTHEEGYDGGAFFSADGSQIVYRAYHPEDPAELEDYRALLADRLVRPTRMEIFVMNADGSGKRQLTDNGAANFAPFFHPSGRTIVFSSNMHDPEGRNFDLYRIGVDGTGLERVTTHPEFDAFPMFTRDGARLVFASNRGAARPGDTNVFIAEWVEEPLSLRTERNR